MLRHFPTFRSENLEMKATWCFRKGGGKLPRKTVPHPGMLWYLITSQGKISKLANRGYSSIKLKLNSFPCLTFWSRNFFFNFSTPSIWNVNNTGNKYARIMKQIAFWRGKNGEYTSLLTFWRRNFFLILAHPVYKMWIIQETNTLELWNKLHFEEEKTESIPVS